MASIHPTAIVSAGARLALDAAVGAFSIIGTGVEIGAGTTIASHVVIADRTRIGQRNRIFQFASVGEMSVKIGPAMEILADVVRRPTFKREEVERLRDKK